MLCPSFEYDAGTMLVVVRDSVAIAPLNLVYRQI
jgi:hypothetical protein